jgi:hypothetical protein
MTDRAGRGGDAAGGAQVQRRGDGGRAARDAVARER